MDSGWLGEGGLFGCARDLLIDVSSEGMGAISGKGMTDTKGLGKGVVLVVIVGVLGSFELGSGEFVGLTTSRLFLGPHLLDKTNFILFFAI